MEGVESDRMFKVLKIKKLERWGWGEIQRFHQCETASQLFFFLSSTSILFLLSSAVLSRLHAELIHLQHSHIWWFDSFLIRSFLCLFCFVTIFTFSADFLSPLFTSCWCHPPLPPPATVLVWCPLFIYFSILHLHFLHPPVPFFSLLSYLFTVQAVTADGYSEGLFAVWNQEGVKFSRSFGMINNVPLGNKS